MRMALALSALLLPSWLGATAVVTFGSGGASQSAGTDISLVFGVPASGGSNRLLMVSVGLNDATDTVQSITFDGLPLTFLSAQNNGTLIRSEIWYLLSPPVGAALTGLVTLNSTSKFTVHYEYYSNVDQINPFGIVATTTTNTTSASIN